MDRIYGQEEVLIFLFFYFCSSNIVIIQVEKAVFNYNIIVLNIQKGYYLFINKIDSKYNPNEFYIGNNGLNNCKKGIYK